ncbi:MAG: TonB-dependent receptor [Candidatus Kapabacteria bacterium]|nr:TonB-dependent receptor [Candidatus Kapabacteria bacterium]
MPLIPLHFALIPSTITRLGRNLSLITIVGCLLSCFGANAWGQQEKSVPLEDLSLEELMNVEVISASKTAEKLSDAPATVIVLTAQDLVRRGYLDISEMFDDLPGMDVTRPYGDTYMKNYWRGYRNTIGSPYLLMVDNIIMNNLYFNEAEGMASLPMANIERVEIVYGPASSVYGANAFMGVINIITQKNRDSSGVSSRGQLLAGSLNRRIADMNLMYKNNDFRVSVSGRFDYGITDNTTAENYEYTRRGYLSNRRLWGALVNNPSLAGINSVHQNSGIDARMYFGNTEIGYMMNTMRTGYGLVYPTDKVQPNGLWARPQWSIHARHEQHFSATFSSTTLLRYRESDVGNDSYFVEGYDLSSPGSRVVDVSFWQSLNNSFSLYQDFTYSPLPVLTVNAGLKFERRDLQKAYDVNYGPSLPPDSVRSIYPMPSPFAAIRQYQNRIVVDDEGAYLQAKYQVQHLFGANDRHNLIAGLRFDNNSVYGLASTLRASYVGNYGNLGLRLMYGQAFQEPVPRTLFGGWRGSGSDPDLKPELSNTIELSGTYTENNLSAVVSLYNVNSQNTIVNTSQGAQNLGARSVLGADIHLQTRIPVNVLKQLSVWGYYSYLSSQERQIHNGTLTDSVARIGDLADHKVYLGVSADINADVNITLRGRFIGQRQTIASNPIRVIDAYTTVDATFTYENLFAKGIGISLRVFNIFNAQYFHPGLRDAAAGTTPGVFDGRGIWRGSASFYNSLLPQPGRTIQLALIFGI